MFDSPQRPSSPLRPIFERFQNLNLIFLIQDLRKHLAAAGNWASGELLCPVAHGMPDGTTVKRLKYLSQAIGLDAACRCAAGELGTDELVIRQFVDFWDATPTTAWLLVELEAIWAERMDDADFMTDILHLDESFQVRHAGENHLVGSPPL